MNWRACDRRFLHLNAKAPDAAAPKISGNFHLLNQKSGERFARRF
jgi:hypothetical protein